MLFSPKSVPFLMAHEVVHPGFTRTLRDVLRSDWASVEEIAARQAQSLRAMLEFAFTYVPYYRDMARNLQLDSRDFATPKDLVKIPVITRQIVAERRLEFLPDKRMVRRVKQLNTGGTSGTPLPFTISQRDRFLGAALMYRAWMRTGYCPGDPIVELGGRSLGIGSARPGYAQLRSMVTNSTKLSAFDMGPQEMAAYVSIINRRHPKVIRGYPSALNVLSEYVASKRLNIWSPAAIITTSETLYPHVRKRLERTFGCRVFDGYGLNDGGVSAQECPHHRGLHVDAERAIMEIVDDRGRALIEGDGRIIATTIANYAMPLIRYDTGDAATISSTPCDCGRSQPLLVRVLGRTTDVLLTPEGRYVHGWAFLYIFDELNEGIREFQVVQETERDLVIRLVVSQGFAPPLLEQIRDTISQFSASWHVRFELVEELPRTAGGKLKFIENRCRNSRSGISGGAQ